MEGIYDKKEYDKNENADLLYDYIYRYIAIVIIFYMQEMYDLQENVPQFRVTMARQSELTVISFSLSIPIR